MEEKEMKQVMTEETAETENSAEETKQLKDAVAEYVLARMPKEMADSLKNGKTMGEVMAQWENEKLKKENETLRQKLEKTEVKPLKLAGEGGEREKDPFALGFMQAFNEY